jgi:hypothetical protein
LPSTHPLARSPTWPPPPHSFPRLALDLSKLAALSIYIYIPPWTLPYTIHVLWRWRRHMFPKRRHFIFTRQGTTQKKIIFENFHCIIFWIKNFLTSVRLI